MNSIISPSQLTPPIYAPKHDIIIISGLSGAGKSLALRFFEDQGYDIIDNLPLPFFAETVANTHHKSLAIGIDIRSRGFSTEFFLNIFDQTQSKHPHIRLIFLEADDEVLMRRYRQTMRIHPVNRGGDMSESIAYERMQMAEIYTRAWLVVDTSLFSPPELRMHLSHHVFLKHRSMLMTILSFSYQRGIPRQADMVFDMRFLPNPYYSDDLRHLNGEAEEIQAYFAHEPQFTQFFHLLQNMLLVMIQSFEREKRRQQLIVAFGCTGGKHRSVFTALQCAQWCQLHNISHALFHRDVKYDL